MKLPVLRAALMVLTGLAAGTTAAAQTTLTGTVKAQSEHTDEALIAVPWRGGAGQVEGRVASSLGVSKVIVSAPMSASGQFSLKLPAALDSSLLPPATRSPLPATLFEPPPGATCTGAIQTSDPTARVVQLALSVKAVNTGGEIFSVISTGQYDEAQAASLGRTQTGLMYYAERPVQMRGTQSCQWREQGYLNKMTIVVAGQLTQGWNRMTLDVTAITKGAEVDTTFRLTSGALPTNDWTLLPDAQTEER
ncbi:hypothetical protein K7W42_13905 [Deinococcus sp. HMF7604]|uniref:hypothetical protein n=1 Tax=Deinococcus betulae TaxID=2873312 RepID=UPI001CC9B261|nr:hypothetical protein [Deinococcus betulae]MBZ9751950.1 hypothetical protein [Deinococcus betulae]